MKKLSNLKGIVGIVLLGAIVLLSCATPAYSNNSRNIQAQRKTTRAKIKRLKFLENLETNKLYKNQQKLEKNTVNLENTKKDYTDAQNKLTSLRGDLSKAVGDYSAIDYKMRRRIRQIYKSQRSGFFELLLSANDFNTFLDRMYFEGLIIKRDYNRMRHARQKAKEIAILKYRIETQKKYISQSIQQMNSQQQTIQKEIEKNQSMIQKLRTDRATYERAERELAKQSSSLQSMISRGTDDAGIKVVSGFIKPIGGRITSPFGWRTHPIFRSRSFHSGIDIAGPYNGSIRASNTGKVIYSGWYGGYGKVVIIDHGRINGTSVTTLYAHMNSINVSKGQYVTKGQVVGYEGTTGYSTGPHVHFEVRLNGRPSNPLNYI